MAGNRDLEMIGGRYRVTGPAWSDPGSVGVLAATDTWLDRSVTVAVYLGPEGPGYGAFTERARDWARLCGSGVAELTDLGSSGGRPFAVWATPAGDTLATALATGPWPASRVGSLTVELASALEFLAGGGLVHGRLHPGSVGLDGVGRALLLPWPAAPGPAGWGGDTAWAAPEVLAGEYPTVWSDRWSMGAVGLAALIGTGPGPLGCEATKALADTVRRGAPEALIGLLTRSLATDPAERAVSLSPAPAPSPSPAPSPGPFRRSGAWAPFRWSGAGAAALVLALGLAVLPHSDAQAGASRCTPGCAQGAGPSQPAGSGSRVPEVRLSEASAQAVRPAVAGISSPPPPARAPAPMAAPTPRSEDRTGADASWPCRSPQQHRDRLHRPSGAHPLARFHPTD